MLPMFIAQRQHIRFAALVLLCLGASLASCSTTRKTAATAAADVKSLPLFNVGLMGRWILNPGDCVLPKLADQELRDASETIVSPAGAVLTLAESGSMIAREGEFVRRGTWKYDGTSLRIIVEPPPRRIEMGFIPVLQADRLTLNGADGMVLVYQRDPFIAVNNTPVMP